MSSFFLSFFLIFFFFLSVVSAHLHKWEKFNNLTGCRLGDTNPAIVDLKKYLHHFGYLSNSRQYHTDSFDDELHSALQTYQHYFNLKVTGVLDPPTVHLLTTPRCGVPDIFNNVGTTNYSMLSGGGRLNYSYFPGRPRWPASRRKLSYAIITTYGSDMEFNTLSQVLASAFQRWADVTDFTFHEVGPYGYCDIMVGFYVGDHGDVDPFDGQLGTLAHAFAPTDGRLHFDSDEDWSADLSKTPSVYAIDLETVAVHEIGHILGMGHSRVKEAIMYPTTSVRTRNVDLANDDILGIRNLYKIKLEPKFHVSY